MWAASENHSEIVELFLANGADIGAITEVSQLLFASTARCYFAFGDDTGLCMS